MSDRPLRGEWGHLREMIRAVWPLLTPQDVGAINGQREELMRRLKARYGKTYGDIEREVTEFEYRDARVAHAARPSLGIAQD